MAINGAYICDIKSEQTIEGKKTFTKEVSAPAFVVKKGPELTSNKEGALLVKGLVSAVGFEGDASRLKNFSVKNMNADDIEQSLAINNRDYVLVQKIVDNDCELKKIKINDMLTLIPSQNGVLFNFITDGSNRGHGAQILKGRSTSGRSQVLNFRTLDEGPNIKISQHESQVEIGLSADVAISGLRVDDTFLAPRRNIDEIKDPDEGSIVYDSVSERFYGFSGKGWVPLQQP